MTIPRVSSTAASSTWPISLQCRNLPIRRRFSSSSSRTTTTTAAGVAARPFVAKPVVEQQMLGSNMTFPLVLAGKGRLTPGEMENTDERSRVLLLDVVLEQGLVLEGLGAVWAGVERFAGV